MAWYARKAGNDYQGLVIDDVTGETIAVAYKEKDAKPLASAPKLLEACKAVLGFHNRGVEKGEPRLSPIFVSMIKHVIAEAEGN